ncbi:MAG: spermidine/putrescine transport system substrate-binding protein [Mycobacterium sp.]|uniref:ABC transporter substrate-binding protein n=1 Tax=Mycobacterium sp. TaxID=1785 RepID=UPI0028B8FE06|nr:spermidine/putrescine transport system substrate-binding protein [Mycobacterium sp.]
MSHRPLSGSARLARLMALTLVVLLACIGVAACSSGGGGGPSDSDATLNVVTWETYHEQPWLDVFTKDTGIKVNATNVGSPDEMFAKVKANPTQYDLVLATSGWFDNYAKADLLVPIDASKMPAEPKPGFDWKSSASSGGKQYGVLYNWGDIPLAWLPGSIPDTPEMKKYLDDQDRPNDWNILWDPAFKGKVSVFDDPTSVMPMIPIALGLPDPYHLTDEQFGQVQDKLNALRPQIKRLTSGFNDQTTQFANGEAVIGVLNNIASAAQMKKDGKTLLVNNEVKQGVPAWTDNYAITKGGANKLDAVYKFINYTMSVPWQARFVAFSGNSGNISLEQAKSPEAVNADLTQEALDSTLIPATASGDKLFSKLKIFQPVENLDKRIDLWNQFKLGISQ